MNDFRPNVQCLFLIDGKILLGKRIGDYNEKGGGTFGVPSGHIEENETIRACVTREVMEETGLTVAEQDIEVVCMAEEAIASNQKHYFHFGIVVKKWTGDLTNCEPDKCEGWDWYDINQLPGELFGPVEMALKAYQDNISFSLENKNEALAMTKSSE